MCSWGSISTGFNFLFWIQLTAIGVFHCVITYQYTLIHLRYSHIFFIWRFMYWFHKCGLATKTGSFPVYSNKLHRDMNIVSLYCSHPSLGYWSFLSDIIQSRRSRACIYCWILCSPSSGNLLHWNSLGIVRVSSGAIGQGTRFWFLITCMSINSS